MTALKRDLTIEVVHWSNMRRLCVIVGDALARMQLLFGTLDSMIFWECAWHVQKIDAEILQSRVQGLVREVKGAGLLPGAARRHPPPWI